MIPADAALDIAAIAARYGVSLPRVRGRAVTWKLDAARAEIAWTLARRWKLPKAAIAHALGRSKREAASFIRRQDTILAVFQNEAARQHQAFLQSDEAAHIRAALDEAKGRIVDLEQRLAWADGRRGESARRADGFTETETAILRIMCANEAGFIHRDRRPSLYRHISNIRKRLPAGVAIRTIVGEGYEIVAGRETLQRLLKGERRARSTPGGHMEMAA